MQYPRVTDVFLRGGLGPGSSPGQALRRNDVCRSGAAMPSSPSYSRRLVLQSGAAAAAASALGAAPFGVAALAQTVPDTPRGVAHHRFALGAREIFVLSDGHMVIPAAMLA